MRLPCFRFTVRRMMAWTSLVGIGLWIGSTYYREATEPARSWLYHLAVIDQSGFVYSQHPAPFWPRYWRRLTGRPWPGTYVCPAPCREREDPRAQLYRTLAVCPPRVSPGRRGKDQPDGFVQGLADEYFKATGQLK